MRTGSSKVYCEKVSHFAHIKHYDVSKMKPVVKNSLAGSFFRMMFMKTHQSFVLLSILSLNDLVLCDQLCGQLCTTLHLPSTNSDVPETIRVNYLTKDTHDKLRNLNFVMHMGKYYKYFWLTFGNVLLFSQSNIKEGKTFC